MLPGRLCTEPNKYNFLRMTDKPELLLIGGGGHCLSVIESIERSGKYKIIGISDLREKISQMVGGYPIVFSDDQIPLSGEKENLYYLVTVGQIKSSAIRSRIFSNLRQRDVLFATVIDPAAIVSDKAEIGPGTVILRNCFVNSGAKIGVNCIINTGAIIEHESTVGDNVHVSTGAIINGDCVIGDDCFVGSGAIISHGIKVGAGSVIGAGAVVLKNVEGGTWLGNPARRIY